MCVYLCALTVRYCLLSHLASGCKSVVWIQIGAAVVTQVKRKEGKRKKFGVMGGAAVCGSWLAASPLSAGYA